MPENKHGNTVGNTVRSALVVVSGLAAVYFVLLVAPGLSQMARMDEVIFLRALKNPPGYIYYIGEGIEAGVLVPRFHPHEHAPLYLQTLDLVHRLFPFSLLVASRLVGVLCVLGIALLIGLILWELVEVRWLSVYALALLGYLTNPLVIRSATFLDINTSVLSLLTLLFVYLCIRFRILYEALRLDRLLVLVFFLCLWTKETTPIALISSLLVYGTYNREQNHRIRNLANVITIAGLGAGIGLLAWWQYAARAAIPFDTPFQVSYWGYLRSSALPSGTSFSVLAGYLVGKVKDFAAVVLWLSPGFFALWVIDLGLRLKRVLRERYLDAWDWMALYGLVVFGGYIVAKGTVWDFPKYHLPMVPIMAVLVASRIADQFSLARNTPLTGSLLVGLGLVLFYWRIGDPLLSVLANSTGTIDELLTLGKCLAFFALGCLVALAAVRRVGKGLLFGLVVTTLAWNLGLSTLQSRAPYSTTYYYGEVGLEQAAELVRANTRSSDFVLARKDLAFAAGRRHVQVDGMGMVQLAALVQTLSPSMVALSDMHSGASDLGLYHQQLHLTLDPMYPHSEIVGDFILFANKPLRIEAEPGD